jgi:hypothetical protein
MGSSLRIGFEKKISPPPDSSGEMPAEEPVPLDFPQVSLEWVLIGYIQFIMRSFLFRSPQERNGTVFGFEQYHRKVTSEMKVIQSFASILAETSITFRIVQ